jgi:hypothetical protein
MWNHVLTDTLVRACHALRCFCFPFDAVLSLNLHIQKEVALKPDMKSVRETFRDYFDNTINFDDDHSEKKSSCIQIDK